MPAASLLTQSSSTTDNTAYASASVTPTAGRVVFVIAASRQASGTISAPTVTGLGATWASAVISNTTGNRAVFVCAGYSSSYSTGAVTITYGTTQTHCMWNIFEVDGIDTTTHIVQTAQATGSSTSPLANLGAFASSSNPTIGGLMRGASSGTPTITAGANFALVGTPPSQTENNGACAAEFFATEDATVDFSLSLTSTWAVIAAELNLAAAANKRRYSLPVMGVG